MKYSGTLTSAKEYAQAGRLEEWVHLYLLSDGGNKPFSDGLKREYRCFFGLADMPVTLFERICGPEEGMTYRVDPESFERSVSNLARLIAVGGELPPMIIQYRDGDFELNDGNHRHAACIRAGRDTFPVIIWITREEDRDAFLEKYGSFMKK